MLNFSPIDLERLQKIKEAISAGAPMSDEEKEKVRKIFYDAIPNYPLNLGEVRPPSFLIDGWIGAQTTIAFGSEGVGKTTIIVLLCLIICGALEGITKDPIGQPLPANKQVRCSRNRDVFYITEDAEQVELALIAYVRFCGADPKIIQQHFHVIHAERQMPIYWEWFHFYANQAQFLRTQKRQDGSDVTFNPCIVLDTFSTNFEVENENDSAEAAKVMEAVKACNRIGRNPILMVGHVGKTDRTNAANRSLETTMRGSSAYSANANQTITLHFADQDTREMVGQKMRFVPAYLGLSFTMQEHQVTAIDDLGYNVPMKLRTCQVSVIGSKEALVSAAKEKGRSDRRFSIAEENAKFVEWLHKEFSENYKGIIISRSSSAIRPERYQAEHQKGYRRLLATDAPLSGCKLPRECFSYCFKDIEAGGYWKPYMTLPIPKNENKPDGACFDSVEYFVLNFDDIRFGNFKVNGKPAKA